MTSLNPGICALIFLIAIFIAILSLASCDDAHTVSHNISKAADNFEVNRRVVFYNGITGDYMLVIEGRCSIKADRADNQLEVTIKTGEREYKKHFLGLSDNVTYFAEQVDAVEASPYFYRVTFKPSVIIPSIDVRLP